MKNNIKINYEGVRCASCSMIHYDIICPICGSVVSIPNNTRP